MSNMVDYGRGLREGQLRALKTMREVVMAKRLEVGNRVGVVAQTQRKDFEGILWVLDNEITRVERSAPNELPV